MARDLKMMTRAAVVEGGRGAGERAVPLLTSRLPVTVAVADSTNGINDGSVAALNTCKYGTCAID